MDHAEVRERLESALLSPGKLHSVEWDATPAGDELREHLASCAACSRELQALRETAALLAAAAPDDLRPPAGARDALLQAIRETGVARPAAVSAAAPGADRSVSARWSRRRNPGLIGRRSAGLALAAVIALLLLGAAAINLAGQRDDSEREVRELAAIMAATDRVLRQPGSQTVVLHDQAGKAAGTIVYSPTSHELVVISDALPRAEGQRFDCYVERSGERRNIGWMHFSSGLAYWAGRVESLPNPGDPPALFVVTRGDEDVLRGEL